MLQGRVRPRSRISDPTDLTDWPREAILAKRTFEFQQSLRLTQSIPQKISKANRRKVPRLRRQSKILTKHDDGQTQSPHTTTSPLLPANTVPRRSSRLTNNEKRSGALEANLAAGPGNSARSPSFTLRRSDRISEQKERISTSTSNATATSAMIMQANPLRCLSRSKSKGCRTGNKSDASSEVKPRGISKRRQSKFSRNKTKIHDCS